MTRLRTLAWLMVNTAICATAAALDHPRPAIAAAVMALAIAATGARRLAVFACLITAIGLAATSHAPTTTATGRPSVSR